MASSDWRLEMENMLTVFNRQAIHSLGLISLAFKGSGLSFSSEFKKYFVQASSNRISEAYDQFQINAIFNGQPSPSFSRNSAATTVSNSSARIAKIGVECEIDDHENGTSIADESDWITNASDSVIKIDNSGYDEVVIEAIETEPFEDTASTENGTASNANQNEIKSATIATQCTSDAHHSDDGFVTTNDLHEINELIALQLSRNASYIIAPNFSSESKFDVEMDDSNDSIEMVENQNDSTDDDDNELNPVHVDLDRLDAELVKDKGKTTSMNQKKPNKKRMMKMEAANEGVDSFVTKGRRASNQLTPRSQKSCTFCGYVGSRLKRHMRTHTGEKPFGCDRCGKRFTSAQILRKHAATHIAEFPFHCRACFHGFSLKADATNHEKHCQKRHFECCLCNNFVTFDKADLARHMRKHTGIRPFRCEVCMKRFGQKENLKRHLNNIHA